MRTIVILLLSILTVLWAILLGGWTDLALGLYDDYDGIHVLDSQKYCAVIGVPRHEKLPIFLTPNDKQSGDFITGENFYLPPTRNSIWVRRYAPPGSESSEVVRKDDLAFAPEDVLKYRQAHGKGYNGVTIADFNHDGHLKVFIISDNTQGGGFIPTIHSSCHSIYGVEEGNVIPYSVTSCTTYPLAPYRLADGRYCFANAAMIWCKQAFCWDNGSYRIHRQSIDNERAGLACAFSSALVNPVAIASGIIPAILLIILFLPGLHTPETPHQKIRWSFGALTIILATLVCFDEFCYLHGYKSEMGSSIAATMLPIITITVVYFCYLKRIWQIGKHRANGTETWKL